VVGARTSPSGELPPVLRRLHVHRRRFDVAEVTPHIVVRDAARAAEWYERTLGAEIGDRIPVPDGRFVQIELRFGNSLVVIADEFPEVGAVSPLTLGGTYGALTITTNAVDELWERALVEGAQVHSPLQDAFWGERHGQIIDPFGHRWVLPSASRMSRTTRSSAGRPKSSAERGKGARGSSL
jgi:PhnB protein